MPTDGIASLACRRELQAMLARLGEIVPALDAIMLEDAGAVYRAIGRIFASTNVKAAEAMRRTGLAGLLAQVTNDQARTAIERAIAESQVRSGVHSSNLVRCFPDLWAAQAERRQRHEERYGAPITTQTWPVADRGRALLVYFRHHPEKLRGRRVLHVSPEPTLRDWLHANVTALEIDYATSSIDQDTDHHADLTAAPFADSSFDLIICHRVLEHIFDETSALAEIRRVLTPNGVCNFSVPESLDMDATEDWLLPDPTLHRHFRQYGSDLPERLLEGGLTAQVDPWLLNRRPNIWTRAAIRYAFMNCGVLTGRRGRSDRASDGFVPLHSDALHRHGGHRNDRA